MRLFLFLYVLCLSLPVSSQDNNSLLWEISGNGLEQSSYLYGTMHVSKKIAFRLDDVFYEALDRSEVIALESDPATWLESDTDAGNQGVGHGFISKGFYTHAFALTPPRQKDLANFLASKDGLVNNILYRTNEQSQNFEEETYLDMFIYQAGSKFKKPILALEDLEESTTLVGRASLNAMKHKPDEWLQQKMQQHDLMSLMQNAYRERNIGLLDSIDKAMYTDHYLKNMLYIRNTNMAQRLDSAIRKAKVFAGIGAAHLPGEKGVINLLEAMGYTVQPLISKATIKGKRLKEKFENSFIEHDLSSYGPEDNFFTMALPYKLYPVTEGLSTTYISPDLANGSYLMVHRIPTFSYLTKSGTYSIDDIDKLLFENIPGKILTKSRIENQGYEGLDIRNRLKNGDYQRYQIFVTPLEILIFKMGGEKDYVTHYSDSIFNSLKIGKPHAQKQVIASGFDDFRIQMPSHYSFRNQKRNGDRLIEGYDPETSSYYFLRKATLNDLDYIEEDSFELLQIQKRFYQSLKLDPMYESLGNNSLVSSADIKSDNQQKLFLKTLFKRGDYYLLGVRTNDEITARNYFKSFELKEASYPVEFHTIKDTALFFSTVSPVAPPKFVESSNRFYQGRKKHRAYDPYTKKTLYQNKNNEAITVSLTKSHDYLSFSSIDSVWAMRKKQYHKQKFGTIREKTRAAPEGYYEMQLTLVDTATTRGILIKNVVKGGLLYELKTSIDTTQAHSAFVSAFYKHFKPADTLIGRDLMEDKTADFFAALRANDSIVLKGYRYLLFDERHADSLIYFISQFEFPADKRHIQSHLIQKLGAIDHPAVLRFFKNYYAGSYHNSTAQAKILQAVSSKGNEGTSNLLLELLSQDLPLVSNSIEIHKIFEPYQDSLPLAKNLFPELLDYSLIAEYKEPVLSLLARLKSRDMVKAGSYKKYKKQLLSDAKIQLKRHLGEQNYSGGKRRNTKTINKNSMLLEDYMILLYPFKKDREVAQFFNRLFLVENADIRTTYAVLLAENDVSMPSGFLDSLAKDLNSRALLFNKLSLIDKAHLIPETYRNQKALAVTTLFEDRHYNPNLDEVFFMEERMLEYKGEHYSGYFFKGRNEMDYSKNYKMYLVVYPKGAISTKPFYKNQGLRIEDTDTDSEAMEQVMESFQLKNRKRAIVYRPAKYNSLVQFGY